MWVEGIAGNLSELDRYFITMGSEENGAAHPKYAEREIERERESRKE